MKEGLVQKLAAPPEMEKINRYTRRPYSPEEVYTFSLVLCDNEVDRDFERFSREALEGLRSCFGERPCCLTTSARRQGRPAAFTTPVWRRTLGGSPRRGNRTPG